MLRSPSSKRKGTTMYSVSERKKEITFNSHVAKGFFYDKNRRSKTQSNGVRKRSNKKSRLPQLKKFKEIKEKQLDFFYSGQYVKESKAPAYRQRNNVIVPKRTKARPASTFGHGERVFSFLTMHDDAGRFVYHGTSPTKIKLRRKQRFDFDPGPSVADRHRNRKDVYGNYVNPNKDRYFWRRELEKAEKKIKREKRRKASKKTYIKFC